jgi:ABC-type transport system involved in cytochrome bd biosynthesis fused ATPase/permease subunit
MAMLSPNIFAPRANRPVGQTLLLGAVVIGTTMLAAVILYTVTGWFWLVVHQGRIEDMPLPAAMIGYGLY